MKGQFITFEGGDGAGKSSHISRVRRFLEKKSLEVVLTREPGGTPLGESLRELVLHQSMSAKMELMLMYAARLHHVEAHILPALQRGAWVLSDRFEDSSFAYQVAGGGASESDFHALSQWALEGFQPNLTFLFDLPIEISKQRVRTRNGPTDKFEQKNDEFLLAVREGFLACAQASGERTIVIDAARTEEEVGHSVIAHLQAWFEKLP